MTAEPRKSAAEAAGFVLAGGKSSRMGSDKALLRFSGRPLVEHALGILASLGLSATIAGARSHLDAFAPVIPDAGRGPLDGVCAGLADCKAPLAVFLSVDMPLFPPRAIDCMLQVARIGNSGAVLFTLNGFIQTFPAVLDPVLLPALLPELHHGHMGCLRAIRSATQALQRPLRLLPVELLVQSGQCEHPSFLPPFQWFLNVNAPADLAAANKLLPAASRIS